MEMVIKELRNKILVATAYWRLPNAMLNMVRTTQKRGGEFFHGQTVTVTELCFALAESVCVTLFGAASS